MKYKDFVCINLWNIRILYWTNHFFGDDKDNKLSHFGELECQSFWRLLTLRLGLWSCMWSWNYCQCQHTDLSNQVSWNGCRRASWVCWNKIFGEGIFLGTCFFRDVRISAYFFMYVFLFWQEQVDDFSKQNNLIKIFFFVHFVWRFLSYKRPIPWASQRDIMGELSWCQKDKEPGFPLTSETAIWLKDNQNE